MTLQKWYNTSVTIPNYQAYGFPEFVASCIGLVKTIVKTDDSKDIKVSFGDCETAYADQKTQRIVISNHFLIGRVQPKLGSSTLRHLPSDEAISMILGLIVHEAAHFAWSPPTLTPFVDFVQKHTPHAFNADLARVVSNIIEDIFIEAEVDRRTPGITWMLDETSKVFFPDDDFAASGALVVSQVGPPTSPEELKNVVNMLIFAKTRQSCNINPWVDHLFGLARTATQLGDINHRLQLVLDIYDRLVAMMPKKEVEEDKGLESLADAVAQPGKPDPNASLSIEGRQVAARAQRTNEALANFEDADVSADMMRQEDGRPYTLLYIEKQLQHGVPLPPDTRYAALEEIARQRATVNRPYGLDKTSGHSLRKLYRIGTDQKIFAELQPTQAFKPMEVIIVVDFSGSMASGKSKMHGMTNTNAYKAAQAALGAASALVHGHCKVAVYCHTADVYNQDVVVYVGKDFNEPIGVLAPRLGHLVEHGRFAENRDGAVIAHLGKKFYPGMKRQQMIVISDGRPTGSGSGGEIGIAQAQKAVNDLRQRNINVMSISITPAAAEVNNRIYGAANNVFNTDVNVVADIIRKMMVS
jgi:hypothetical protein